METTQMSIKVEWKNRPVYSYNGILITIKRHELWLHLTQWRNLKNIILSENS